MSVTGFAGMLNLKGLRPELLPPGEIFAGSAAPFRLRLCNTKRRLPSFLIRVECNLGPGITLPVVAPGTTVESMTPLTFPQRGPANIGTIRVSSSFPVNFFTRFWTFSADGHFVVFPRLLRATASGFAVSEHRSGESIRRERGLDGELERVAGYSGREPLRAIHWKLSARGNDLLVKEFGSQSAPPLIIDPDDLSGASLEERLSQAAWLVRSNVHQRPVGLHLGGRTFAPDIGRDHGILLLKELALHGLD